MKYLISAFLLLFLLAACSPTPQAVEFGTDACAHCKMTIVEKPFCAEVVSAKGKAFKFDAIECMVHYLEQKNEEDYSLFLVRDFTNPDDWQDARQSFYLISENLPSPMGAFLSAYASRKSADMMQEEMGGQVFDWNELKQEIRRN